MATSARAAAKKIALTERQKTAIALRKSGASYRAIAAHIAALPGNEKYSEGLAHADVTACLKALVSQTSLDTEAYRSLELERLDIAQLAIAKKVQSGDSQQMSSALLRRGLAKFASSHRLKTFGSSSKRCEKLPFDLIDRRIG